MALVMYFCFTNQLLYTGDNDLDILYRAACGPTAEDLERIVQLPPPAAEILQKALSVDPNDRFQSAEEFAAALAPHATGMKAEAASLMELLFGDELRTRSGVGSAQPGYDAPAMTASICPLELLVPELAGSMSACVDRALMSLSAGSCRCHCLTLGCASAPAPVPVEPPPAEPVAPAPPATMAARAASRRPRHRRPTEPPVASRAPRWRTTIPRARRRRSTRRPRRPVHPSRAARAGQAVCPGQAGRLRCPAPAGPRPRRGPPTPAPTPASWRWTGTRRSTRPAAKAA